MSFEKIGTLHTATTSILNPVTDIFLQLLQGPQNRCPYHNLNLFSAETNYKKLTYLVFILHTVEIAIFCIALYHN